MRQRRSYGGVIPTAAISLLAGMAAPRAAIAESGLDLTHATLVVRSASSAPLVERTAATVLIEEIERRTGVKLTAKTSWPASGCAIALLSGKGTNLAGVRDPEAPRTTKVEGYTIATDVSDPA